MNAVYDFDLEVIHQDFTLQTSSPLGCPEITNYSQLNIYKQKVLF